MSKHTPGPWTMTGGGNVFASRQRIAEISMPFDGFDIMEDNARLIAAAPDLLEALKAVYNTCEASNKAGREAMNKARDAIAKAEGT